MTVGIANQKTERLRRSSTAPICLARLVMASLTPLAKADSSPTSFASEITTSLDSVLGGMIIPLYGLLELFSNLGKFM